MVTMVAALASGVVAPKAVVASSKVHGEATAVLHSETARPALLSVPFNGLRSGVDFGGLKQSVASAYEQSVHVQRSQTVTTVTQGRYRHRTFTVVAAGAVESKNILILGGTRFIGLFLARMLVKEGHQVTLFTRGKAPVTSQLPGETDSDYQEYSSKVTHIKGDRQDFDDLKLKLEGTSFQVVYDINGREAAEAEPIVDALQNLEQYIFCSSAGVYMKSDLLPHREIDAGDPKSRHKGKLDTEALLESKGVPWTSIRPVYIYGPLNYNPVEEWFFHRLKEGRPIPVPNSGLQVTQLGHVKDLASAFVKVLGNKKAIGQVYNISGSRYVTFDGIARACAKAAGLPPPQIVHYNPKDFDFGKKKAFPLRDQGICIKFHDLLALHGFLRDLDGLAKNMLPTLGLKFFKT